MIVDFLSLYNRQSEVEHLGVVVRRDHDVGRLEVAVDEALFVGVLQAGGDLGEQPGGAGGAQRAVSRDDAVEVPAGDVLHGDVVGAVIDAGLVGEGDVRVIDLAADLHFAPKPGQHAAFGLARRQHLEGDEPAVPFVAGEVNDAHAALADGGEHLIRPQH